MNALFNEIVGCRYYTMQKSVFGGYRANVFNFLNTRQTEHQKSEKHLQAVARFVAGQLSTDAARLTNFRVYDDEWDEDGDSQDIPKEDVKYINILRLTGPMTRGGGECSYGSLEMRDMLMEAADRDDVIAHIIYCRTPGGMATTLIDFRKAIDYIHSKGQKIYMFCDGTVASGGAFLSAMCDGVFAYNEEDEIGSIGMYTAFFTMENGAVNAITQEKYVEYYAEKSTEKNRPYRDGGDMEAIAKETIPRRAFGSHEAGPPKHQGRTDERCDVQDEGCSRYHHRRNLYPPGTLRTHLRRMGSYPTRIYPHPSGRQ